MARALAWFAGLGVQVERVLTDNGWCYRSQAFQQVLAQAGAQHRRTRPYRHQTNGKAERFNRTQATEWSYARLYTSNQTRLAALPGWLHHYNCHRPHTALEGRSPMERNPGIAEPTVGVEGHPATVHPADAAPPIPAANAMLPPP